MLFNPNEVDPTEGQIKTDWYDVVIAEADEYENKKRNGRNVELHYVITKGQHKNFRVRDYIAYVHSNPEAQRIGRQTLRKICDAIGIDGEIGSESVFVGKHLSVRLVENSDSTFPDAKDYRPIEKVDFTDMDEGTLPEGNGRTPPPRNFGVKEREIIRECDVTI
jgi:hypothetical protein